MQSSAADVLSYMEQVPAARRAVMEKIRLLCKRLLKGYEECMEYGVPAYKRNGALEVSFASQVQYISLYVLKKDVLDRHRKAFSGCQSGKGCIRFRNVSQIDFKAVSNLLRDTAKSKSKPC